MKASDPSVADVSRQGAFSRAMHSIRSRYSLSTAVFLLFLLALFYAGGRVVLVHLVRDAENQVKEIGSDLSRLVYKDAEQARGRMEAFLDEALPSAAGPADLVSPRGRLLGAFRVGAPSVPVIVSSGSSEEEIREMFSAHPYDFFLAKPYTLDELKRAVSTKRA